MSLSTRPLAIALTIALMGAVGVADAAPGPTGMQDSEARRPRAQPRPEPPPQARPRSERPQPAPAPRQRQERPRHVDPLSDSVRRIERRTRGQVISAERVPYDGRSVSRVKVVDEDGRVRVYMDDPQAGAGTPRTRRDDD